MKRKVLLLVDLSYQCYRASAAHPMLRDSDDRFTGGLYGFLAALAKQIRESRATKVVICQDRKPYKRSDIYPEYKLLRKKKQDDELLERHKESMPYILSALEAIGLPLWGVQGYESDDMVGHAVRKYRHRYDSIVAASNDSDLFALLKYRGFFVMSKGDEWMSAQRLMQKHGVTPDEYVLMTALTGTHNDIAGIPRVGPMTALKAIKDPALMRKLRDGYAEVIDRNLRLIQLPMPGFPSHLELPRNDKRFSPRDLYKFCALFDIDATGAMCDAFEQVSQG